MSTNNYPEGLDCVWLASDRDGCVGAFVTAGAGPIPSLALDASDVPLEDIEQRLWELPSVSDVRLLVSVKRPDSFIELAQRGVFVFDWTDIHRTKAEVVRAYELVAVPLDPIVVLASPPDLAALAVAATLANVSFADGQMVDVRTHLKCRALG